MQEKLDIGMPAVLSIKTKILFLMQKKSYLISYFLYKKSLIAHRFYTRLKPLDIYIYFCF